MEPGNDYPIENPLNYRTIRRQKGFMRSSLLKVLLTCTMGCALVYSAQAWKPFKEPWRIDKALKSAEENVLRPVTHDPKALGKLTVTVIVTVYCPPAAGGAVSLGGVAAAGAASAAYDGLVYHADPKQMAHSFVIGSGGALITVVSPNFPGNAYVRGVQSGMANIVVRIGADYAFYGKTDLQGRNLTATMGTVFVPAFDIKNEWTAKFVHGAAKSFVAQAMQNEGNLKRINFGKVVEGGSMEVRNAFVTQKVGAFTKSMIAKFENNTQTDSADNKKSNADNKKVTAKMAKSKNKRPLNSWNKLDISKAEKNAFGRSSKDIPDNYALKLSTIDCSEYGCFQPLDPASFNTGSEMSSMGLILSSFYDAARDSVNNFFDSPTTWSKMSSMSSSLSSFFDSANESLDDLFCLKSSAPYPIQETLSSGIVGVTFGETRNNCLDFQFSLGVGTPVDAHIDEGYLNEHLDMNISGHYGVGASTDLLDTYAGGNGGNMGVGYGLGASIHGETLIQGTFNRFLIQGAEIPILLAKDTLVDTILEHRGFEIEQPRMEFELHYGNEVKKF